MAMSEPWIEKYRPKRLEQIVLDPLNRRILRNIVRHGVFPNLLLHGPGGTGKTTTVMAVLQEWFDRSELGGAPTENGDSGKHALMHRNVVVLNASDDRGIDVIRNQIQQFSRSTPWSHSLEPASDPLEYKFVILDEADAMTRQAQSALKTVMRTCAPRVRFCLLCNYMSRVDESLRSEFVCMRFSQMPPREVENFVRRVAGAEGVCLTDADVEHIHRRYGSDIRSMVNHLQVRHHMAPDPGQSRRVAGAFFRAPTAADWEQLRAVGDWPGPRAAAREWIRQASARHNLDPQALFGQYFAHLVRARPEEAMSPGFLARMKRVVHADPETDAGALTDYFVDTLRHAAKTTAAAETKRNDRPRQGARASRTGDTVDAPTKEDCAQGCSPKTGLCAKRRGSTLSGTGTTTAALGRGAW